MFCQKKESHPRPEQPRKAFIGKAQVLDPTITINTPVKRKRLVETLPDSFLTAAKDTRKNKAILKRNNTADGVRRKRDTQSAIDPLNNNHCANCKAFLTDGDDEAPFGEIPAPVDAVLYKLRNSKEKKNSEKTKEVLDEILARVSCALQNAEVYNIFTSSSSHDSIASTVASVKDVTPQNKTLIELAKKKPEAKKKSKREVTEELLEKTEALSDTKKVLMHELDSWFENIQTEWEKICSSQANHTISAFFASPLDAKNKTNTLKLLNKFEESTNKLRILIQEQLRSAIEQAQAAAQAPVAPVTPDESESESSDESSTDEEADDYVMPLSELAGKIARDTDQYSHVNFNPEDDLSEALVPIKRTLLLGKRLATKRTYRKSFNAGSKHLDVITRVCNEKELELKRLAAINHEKDVAITNIIKSRDEMEQSYAMKLKQAFEENDEHVKTIANQEVYIETLLTPQVAVVESLKSLSSDQSSVIISDRASAESDRQSSRQVSPEQQDIESMKSASPPPRMVMVSSSEPSEHTPSPISMKSISKHSVIVPVEELRVLETKLETLAVEKEQVTNENAELKKKVLNIEEDISKMKKDTTKIDEIRALKRKHANQEQKYTRLANDKRHQESKIKELEEKLANKSKFQRQLEQPKEIDYEKEIPGQNTIEETLSLEEEGDPKKKKTKTVSLVVHRQALTKVKKNWNDDVRNLRNLIISEQHRFQANLRKTESENQKSLDKQRNDNVSTVKALHRFRGSVDRLVNDMNNGRIDSNLSFGDISVQSSIDSRKELSMYDKGDTLSETANEILLSLERKLKTFMLSKQLLVKEANSSKVFAEKELVVKDITLSRIKQDLDEQNEKLKTVYEQESSLRGEYKKVLLANHDLQKKGSTPQGKKNEKDNGQKATQKQMTPIQKSSPEVGTISTCKESLKIVDFLYENEVLTDKDYDIAIATVDQLSKLSNDQLVILVKRYVALKRILAIRENIISIRKQYKDKKRFKNYFNAAEARYRSAMQDLEVLNVDTQKKRGNIFCELGQLYLKSNMKCLSIIPLASPNVQPVTPMKKPRQRIRKAVEVDRGELDKIIGERVDTGNGPREPCWEMPSELADITVSTPKMLEMDVHPWKRMIKSGNLRLPSIAQVYP